MNPIPCVPCCSVPTTTNIPGVAGLPGDDGADGISAYAILGGAGLAAIPVDGADTPSLTFSGPGTTPTAWMVVGEYVILGQGPGAALANPGPYTFQIKSIDSVTNATLTRRAAANDGTSVSVDIGAYLSPVGAPSPLSAPLPTAITDNSTGAASNTVAAGVGVETLEFPHTFIGGTSPVNPVLNFTMPYKFKILSWYWVTEVLLVGAGGSRVANMEVGAVDVGTVVSTVTVAIASAAVGSVIAGTAVAGAATTGAAGVTFSIEFANGGTAFTAGAGTFVVVIQNMDTADAVASLSKHVNDLITSLT